MISVPSFGSCARWKGSQVGSMSKKIIWKFFTISRRIGLGGISLCSGGKFTNGLISPFLPFTFTFPDLTMSKSDSLKIKILGNLPSFSFFRLPRFLGLPSGLGDRPSGSVRSLG